MSAWILSLEPEHRRTDGSPPRRETWRPPEFCATLKLLVASVVLRRNIPPSSRVSKQWPRSCGLTSDAPSRASFPWPAKLDRSRATDPGGFANSSGVPSATAELYNPATGTFTTTGSLNAARQGDTATLLNNGMVLIAGGFNSSGAV